MRNLLLAAAALILAPATAHAEDWVLVVIAENHMGAFFVDMDSLQGDPTKVRSARVLAVLREDDDGRAAALSRIAIDCVGHRRRLEAGMDYDAQGQPVKPNGAAPWASIPDGSNYVTLMEVLCTDKPFDGEHFGDKPPVAAGRQLLEEGYVQADKPK